MSQKKQGRANGKPGGSGVSRRNALWLRKREGERPLVVALVACVCVVAIVAGYLLQGSALLDGRAASSAAAQSAIQLSEIMSENGSTLFSNSGDAPDWIEIVNSGSASVNLSKYSLLVESNINKVFVFPDVSIAPGEYLVIYAEGSDAATSGEALSAPFRLAASGGDSVVLLNAQGAAIDSVTTPELGVDEVFCRDADGVWQISGAATPGRKNEIADEGSGAAKVRVQGGAVEISEVMSSNTIYCPDENGEIHDYVELHNISDSDVNLEGWYLSDSSDKLKKWSFPAVKIPAGGYLVVYCSGYDRTEDPRHLHTSFKLSSAGESVYLSNADGQTVSAVDLPALSNGQAYSYFEGAWSTQLAPTPGLENSHESGAALNAQLFGTVAGVCVAIITNVYLIFPFYIKLYGMDWASIIGMCTAVNPWIHDLPTMVAFSIIPFNVISMTVISLIAMLVYKKISVPLKKLIQ